MLKIAYNKVSRNIEYSNGRLIDDRPTTTGNPAFHLAVRAFNRFGEDAATRLWKAAQLVEAGHVTTVENPAGHDGATVATVKSQTDKKIYYVSRLGNWEPGNGRHSNHKYSCTCVDYRRRFAPVLKGQPNCKHILAASMQDYINTHDVIQQYLNSVPKRQALEPGEIVDVMNQSDARYRASAYAQRKREVFNRMRKIGTPEGAELIEADRKPQPF